MTGDLSSSLDGQRSQHFEPKTSRSHQDRQDRSSPMAKAIFYSACAAESLFSLFSIHPGYSSLRRGNQLQIYLTALAGRAKSRDIAEAYNHPILARILALPGHSPKLFCRLLRLPYYAIYFVLIFFSYFTFSSLFCCAVIDIVVGIIHGIYFRYL